ncbi:MAG TPA: hypothetical protein VJX66_18925 [Amycolatopsis sp.]|nr:hypothetical protein [Amycolatopsis sp.]
MPVESAQGLRVLWHVHGSWTDAFVRGQHRFFLPVTAQGDTWGRGLAERTDIPIVHVTHFNAVMWDSGRAPAVVVPGRGGVISTDFSLLAKGFHELVHEPDYATPTGRAAREYALKHYGLDAFLAAWDRVLAESTR